MKKIFNIKKIFVVLTVVAVSLTVLSTINYVGAWAACLSNTPLSSKVVEENGSLQFTLKYTNDINAILVQPSNFSLEGFTANVNVAIDKTNSNNRVVTLSNIQDEEGTAAKKRVYVAGGTAVSSDGRLANSVTTETFTIKESASTSTPTTTDNVAPVATISGPSASSVYAGGTVTYKITYTDNVGIKAINLNANDIRLSGFTANKNVSINGNVATITLSNIQGSIGGDKVIYVTGGTAIDNNGNLCNAVTGSAFSIVQKASNNSNNNNNNSNNNSSNNQTTENNNKNDGKPSDWVANPNTGK